MASLRDELLAIREENGRLTPAIVVDAARTPNHPLHGKFEWDDTVAAELHRRSQAADLIRSVRVSYLPLDDDRPISSIRAFHAVTRPGLGHVYDPVEEIAADPIARALLLREMERDWRAMRDRWESFSEFWVLVTGDLEEAV